MKLYLTRIGTSTLLKDVGFTNPSGDITGYNRTVYVN